MTDQVRTYRKRPTTVEAVQWPCDVEILTEWIGPQATYFPPTNDFNGGWDELTWRQGSSEFLDVWNTPDDCWKEIPPGHWVLKGEEPGDFYPCHPDIFEATYDLALEGISTKMEEITPGHWAHGHWIHVPNNPSPERRQVYSWLAAEEVGHQDLKFTEATKTAGPLSDDNWTHDPLMTKWSDKIGMYLHRADILGLDNPLGRQAAAKAVATAHGMLESIVRVHGDLPPGGVPSGEINGHVDPMGEEADHG